MEYLENKAIIVSQVLQLEKVSQEQKEIPFQYSQQERDSIIKLARIIEGYYHEKEMIGESDSSNLAKQHQLPNEFPVPNSFKTIHGFFSYKDCIECEADFNDPNRFNLAFAFLIRNLSFSDVKQYLYFFFREFRKDFIPFLKNHIIEYKFLYSKKPLLKLVKKWIINEYDENEPFFPINLPGKYNQIFNLGEDITRIRDLMRMNRELLLKSYNEKENAKFTMSVSIPGQIEHSFSMDYKSIYIELEIDSFDLKIFEIRAVEFVYFLHGKFEFKIQNYFDLVLGKVTVIKGEVAKGLNEEIIDYEEYDKRYKRLYTIYPEDDYYDFFFAFRLRQTSIREVNYFLDYHSHLYGRGFAEFLQSILTDNEFIFQDKTMHAVSEWIKENKTKASEGGKLEVSNSVRIRIKKEFITQIANILEPYFDQDEFLLLKKLLIGEELKVKLTFHGNQNQFTFFFSELKRKEKILNQSIDVQYWICCWFLYKRNSKAKSKSFNSNTVDSIFKGKLPVTPKKQIKNESLP